MRRSIFLGERRQHLVDRLLTNVHQHVGIRKPFHRPDLIPLCLRDNAVQWLPAIVFLQNLPVRHRSHPIVVKIEPPGLPIWFDEREVVSTMEVTRVYEDTVKLVFPRFGPVSRLVKEFIEVDFKGEFEAIVDLREFCQNRTSSPSTT